MQPATIKIFLVEGNPEGIRTAEISNWTGKAIAGPRSELASLLKREELLSPGVYLLTGKNAETAQDSLYIGEAESVTKRLRQHRDRDDWSQVAAIVSKDENLTKAHIRYLEGKLIELAIQAGNAQLQNNASSGSKLPESDKADMDVFLEKLLQLLPVLGVDLFKIITEIPNNSNDLLYCNIKGLKARGRRSTGGFVVYAGSQAVSDGRSGSANWVLKRREELLDKEHLIAKDGFLEFSKDIEFASPSAAGSVIRGGNTNGLTSWKNSAGVSLKVLEQSE
jgi:hypothetical protein